MTRYAVYAIPGIGPNEEPAAIRLLEAATQWLSRPDFADLTVNPRRYGFHATLKAPFRLAVGATEAQLKDTLTALCRSELPVAINELRLLALHPNNSPAGDSSGFRALTPVGDQEELNQLASTLVRNLDEFRAPLNEADRVRRNPAALSPLQRTYLERYGYPLVLEEFQAHFTLTDPVPASRSAAADAALKKHFAAVEGTSFELLNVALCCEPAPGRPFEVLSIHPLGTQN